MKPWWVRWPKRLGHELKSLRDAGISYRLDKESFINGTGILHLELNSGQFKGLNLTASFPEIYPYSRFEIFAPDLQLEHHQNHFTKGLCLLDSESGEWRPSFTVAQIIVEQLPKLFQSNASQDIEEINQLEVMQAEPFSYYYDYVKDYIALIDGNLSIPPKLNFGKLKIGVKGTINTGLQFTILKICDSKNQIISETSPELISAGYDSLIYGSWVRVTKPIMTTDPQQFHEILKNEFPFLKKYNLKPNYNGQHLDFIGVVFPEETKHRQLDEGWTFFLNITATNKRKRPSRKISLLVRPAYVGKKDIAARNSFITAMNKKRVAIFGLGCLGAPSALEFARNGVGKLFILDCDHVEPGIISRWPYGLEAAGRRKADFLEQKISENYPYTKIKAFHLRLGDTLRHLYNNPEVASETEVLKEVFSNVDLIYDATAELNLQHLLSDYAKAYAIPYIAVSTTFGAWGGLIIRIHPGNDKSCWSCLQYSFDQKKIDLPVQNETAGGFVQPAGCNSRTFTGAGFDTSEIVLGGLRLAISTLTSDEEHGYPATNWDVAVVNLRNNDGDLIPPSWQTYTLEKNPSCFCNQNMEQD